MQSFDSVRFYLTRGCSCQSPVIDAELPFILEHFTTLHLGILIILLRFIIDIFLPFHVIFFLKIFIILLIAKLAGFHHFNLFFIGPFHVSHHEPIKIASCSGFTARTPVFPR